MAPGKSVSQKQAAEASALRPQDAVILVAGFTGSGKSSFIKLLAEQYVHVGHGLRSDTATVQPYSCTVPGGQRVFLIDTPGFNDTVKSDSEVLQEIAFFLAQLYSQSIHLTGIVYLHDITVNRMTSAICRNLRVFQELCGQAAYPHVVLATTMWGKLASSALSDRGKASQRELLSRPEWWGRMKDAGSRALEHDGSKESAQNIVQNLISSRDWYLKLAIQDELVCQNLSLDQTSAGIEATRSIRERQEQMRSEMAEVEQNRQELTREDASISSSLRSQESELRKDIERAGVEQQSLKIDLESLVKVKQAEYQMLLKEVEKERAENDAAIRKYEEELQRLREQPGQRGARQQQRETELVARLDERKTRRKRDVLLPLFRTLAGVGTVIAGFFGLGGTDLIDSTHGAGENA